MALSMGQIIRSNGMIEERVGSETKEGELFPPSSSLSYAQSQNKEIRRLEGKREDEWRPSIIIDEEE